MKLYGRKFFSRPVASGGAQPQNVKRGIVEDENEQGGPEEEISALAKEHRNILSGPGKYHLKPKLRALERHFPDIYKRIAARIEAGETGTRGEEWLLDNRHVVQEALELVRESLPPSFLKQLPKIRGGEGRPDLRVRVLAVALLSTDDKPLDMERIRPLVERYQDDTVLTTGELWALPAVLRLALLESLAGYAEDVLGSEDDEQDFEAAELGGVGVASAIISLRDLRTCNWREFVEGLSRVEMVLRQDPAEAYTRMDFKTRDSYRGAVEKIARGSGRPEYEVAERALELSRAQASDSRKRHVGFYLVGDGRRQFEESLECRLAWGTRLYRWITDHALAVYFAGLAVFFLPPLVGLAVYLIAGGTSAWVVVSALLLTTIPLLGFALALVNGLITHSLPPRKLPKLNFETGIPADYRTAVVMPVLIADTEDVHRILQCVEINYLNNTDNNLVYVVLSDFADAGKQDCDSDSILLKIAEESLSALNRRYGLDSTFLLLHRRRCWNAAEGCWMGWERKRGKLVEFNRLIHGDEDTTFETCFGDRAALHGLRYVITLDADTQMPPGTARRLVGTIAHPLNRAQMDTAGQRVAAGYGFLQPRLEIDPADTADTMFTEIFSGDRSVDLYTHAVSDAYQDLFGEGIFAGKGIYDPEVLEQTLAGRLPENAVLSHDLLEGAIGGTALLSDTVVYEQYPPNVFALLRRSHRWIRGDWQLLPWLRRRVPATGDTRVKNPLPLIHQWKIADNLRRSLEAPGVLLLFLLAWSGWLPGSAWAWTLALLALTAAPVWVELLSLLWRSAASPLSAHRHFRGTPGLLRQRLLHWLLSLALLPYQAVSTLDAIVRTLYRLGISRRHLLEWRSCAHVNRALGRAMGAVGAWREMWISPALAAIVALGLIFREPASLLAAAPLLLAWLIAPQLTRWIDRPPVIKQLPVGEEDRRELRLLGRRTWFFFQQFMGPNDHWLPPDNYQEEPLAVLARRTSPTNIGLGLLSVLSAYDFGYIDLTQLLASLNNSFDRMGSLERYRGHFLNWFETRELRPLLPRYVSTVDSGNLAGSLLALAGGLEEMLYLPPAGRQLVLGVVDTLGIIEETLQPSDGSKPGEELREIIAQIRDLRDRLEERVEEGDWWSVVEEAYQREIPELQERMLALIESDDKSFSAEALGRLRHWLDELHHQRIFLRRHRESIEACHPLLEEPPAAYRQADTPLADNYGVLTVALDPLIPLGKLAERCWEAEEILERLEAALADSDISQEQRRQAEDWNSELRTALQSTREHADKRTRELRGLATRARNWVQEMEFGFLYDQDRHLFRIGYNVTDASLDPNYYDLLASESRLAGFIAVAKGDVPSQHWLHLERPFRRLKGKVVLMSWSATLFEYLMPRLLMETPDHSLIAKACRNAIEVHRDFTRRLGLPWGISESGYYQLDTHLHYQYRAFGVPGIGFRRDLGDRLVISPYSSMMALPFDAAAVVDNLRGLRTHGGYGQYGLYEAIDFGRTAKAAPRRARTVRSYMSHHQGMIMLALNNFFHADIMLRRFHREPRIAGLTPLLHERIPSAPAAPVPWSRPGAVRGFHPAVPLESWWATLHGVRPQYNLLSNGHYTLINSAEGGGGSYWHNIALTRWQPDPTREQFGHWCYVRDLDKGTLFSIGLDPCGADPSLCAASFAPHSIEYQRRESELFCRLRIAISSQHDLEVRRLIIKNESARPRRLLLGTYAEVVLAPEQEDRRHPAFAKLFVESHHLPEEQTMLYRRRPRSSEEKPIYLGHSVLVQPGVKHRLAWETDRWRFLGRGGSPARPQALQKGLAGFSGTTGAVLDPVIATGVELTVPAQSEVEVAYLTGVSKSRQELMAVLRSRRSLPQVHWIFDLARMQSEHELQNLRMASGNLRWMMELLSALFSPDSSVRAPSRILGRGRQLQSSLWSRGISGDNPILLLQVQSSGEVAFAEPILQAHTYWCGRGIAIDLVIIDEDSAGYEQNTRDRLQYISTDVRGRTLRKLNGSVFIVPGRELPGEERERLMAAARVVLDSAAGPVSAQIAAPGVPQHLPPFVPVRPADYEPQPTPELERPEDLLFDNGIGGFSADGREYVLHLERGQRPPAPWVNVIANPSFGCLVTEAGSCCTWSGNSGEHRLTAWQNDPVRDPSGEVLYLRDEETAEVWSPTPAPRPADAPYQVRHGAGYTEYRHNSHGMEQAWRVFVHREAPVKIGRLTLTNSWDRPRRITATYYVEWVLGLTRAGTWPYIVSEFESHSEVLLARNTFTRDADAGVAFLAASLPVHGLTTDRTEFLGKSGGLHAPAAMFCIGLSGEVDHGGDPCAAYQVHIDLEPGATEQIYFVLGEGADRKRALELAEKFSDPQRAESTREEAEEFWEEYLGSVQIETPDKATDLLVNRWLPYQTLACRLWGRSGYYQSSGAFGFRDQLQDVQALLWTHPEWTREHILRAASRQFQDGDVLHWWHENPLRGVRTRCSDDLLWLPFVTAEYIRTTGDYSILEEWVSYLQGPPLEKDENERYTEYETSAETGSLYEHCCRAIERAGAVGPHGLPVIGNGDWNDGFNRISTTGRGESVWLGWFLVRVCRDMAPLCEHMGDGALANHYRELGENLKQQVEENGWDGAWYRRAYYDDGTPVGSEKSDECKIDLIAQTWSVLAPEKPVERAPMAMQSAYRHLVREEARQILLLAPPFNRTKKDPGYIKGYPPGIRENGGQYTHAATWAVWAAAGLRDSGRAWHLFDLLNPITHTSDAEGVQRYRTEPYVLAGDVYGVAPHVGRGGWTWYSGASAWLYRGALEVLLGLRVRGDNLEIKPCLPPSWERYRATLRRGNSSYDIEVENCGGCPEEIHELNLDGEKIDGPQIPFRDDGERHRVRIVFEAQGSGD
ncbi:GH36-type glycosyl hydrolase domain-containing protein [Microbulbifer rhizosphaerae]|uniref:Cyclic beta-1,2-glucan synthetase n=1 Tax=Microbulbifer rhizosphaerae TaxID=1562603 RepID=A0A7W4Z7U2_9GAMM|nr:glucoamylase family protein [Microbulbifer rhizosphaerae]MBB3060118.1 cyclic beta-1,2-glucan synthetase [Microbulbifer rhizosphaerae]